MKRLLLILVCGCSSGGSNHVDVDMAQPPAAGWTLTGTLAGYKLQNEAVSGEAHGVAGGVLVQLSSRAKVCDLLQQNSCPDGRLLVFRIGGTETGTFTVVDKAPGGGQARIQFLDLDPQCLEKTMLGAGSGTLTVTGSDLQSGGLYSFSFDAVAPGGSISGQVAAPFCQI
jgi:hypothetical protein